MGSVEGVAVKGRGGGEDARTKFLIVPLMCLMLVEEWILSHDQGHLQASRRPMDYREGGGGGSKDAESLLSLMLLSLSHWLYREGKNHPWNLRRYGRCKSTELKS